MKQIISLLIALSSVAMLTASAQGSLQFSQVLMVGNTPQTVPPDKIWKVESYLIHNTNTSSSQAAYCSATTSNVAPLFQVAPPSGALTNFYVRPVTAQPTTSGTWGFAATFPFWLPAGSQLASNCPSWYLSVIEFNVLP